MGYENAKKNAFLKNKAGELLKTKDEAEKQTENKAETKPANLLQTIGTPKNKAKTNRKTKLAILLEINGRKKTNRKQSGQILSIQRPLLSCLLALQGLK